MDGQTGRTDTTKKSCWWSITAFNDDMDMLVAIQEGERDLPNNWRQLYGGVEECPKTGKKHFQGALNTASVRMANIKSILSTAHIEPVRSNAECLKKYAMKSETAVGEKSVVKNLKYYSVSDVLLLFAEKYVEKWMPYKVKYDEDILEDEDKGFARIGSEIIREKYELVALISQPQVARAWKLFHWSIISVYEERRDKLIEEEEKV